MVDYDDEALARMRAADPATGSYPDQALLRRKLAGRTPLGQQGAGTDDDAVAVRVDSRTTRGSRMTLAAAATVTALALGAGGYAVGLQAADGRTDGSQMVAGQQREAEPAGTEGAPQKDDPGTADGAAGGGVSEGGSAEGPLVGESDSGAGEAQGGDLDMASSYAGFGATVLTAGPGLSTGTGSGTVELLRPPEDLDKAAFLSAWARALGLEGQTSQLDEQTSQFTSDSASLTVTVAPSFAHFDYTHPARDPYCAEMFGSAEEGMQGAETAGPTEDVQTLPAPPDCADPGEVPSEDKAVAQAREFLSATGLDLSGYEYTAESWAGDPYVQVTGRPADRGHNTSVNVMVTGAGVANASGSLGEYVSLGDYPVVSEVEAVNRFNDTRFSNQGFVWIPALDADGEGELTEPGREVVMVAPSPGDPIPFPTSEATIVEASLERGVMNLPDGTELIVPAYDLVDEDGRHYPMLAVADDALDFTPGG